MIKRIKTLYTKIKTRMFYDRCYNNMEDMAIAVFGMCLGGFGYKYFNEKCKHCPYFINIKKGGAE